MIAEPAGKYDVSRQLQGGNGLDALLGAGEDETISAPGVRLLPVDVE